MRAPLGSCETDQCCLDKATVPSEATGVGFRATCTLLGGKLHGFRPSSGRVAAELASGGGPWERACQLDITRPTHTTNIYLILNIAPTRMTHYSCGGMG